MGILQKIKGSFQPLVNEKDIIKQKQALTPQQQALMTFGGGQAVGFDQPEGPQSFFPSLNATEGPVRGPQPQPTQQGGFDLGGMLGGVGKFFGENPALLAGVVGTGLGLASGQLSPIQSLGAGAQGAQGILNQQREDDRINAELQAKILASKGFGTGTKPISEYLEMARKLYPNARPDQLTGLAQGLAQQDLTGTPVNVKQTRSLFGGKIGTGFLGTGQLGGITGVERTQ